MVWLARRFHSTLVLLVAIVVSIIVVRFPEPLFRRLSTLSHSIRPQKQLTMSSEAIRKGDVWFISHGGPPTMFDYEGPGYKSWIKMGKGINRPDVKGIVIVSAHWESSDTGGRVVQIHSMLDNPLVYDFYNFPKHYYAQKFHSHSTPEQRQAVKTALKAEGIHVEEVDRGIDHGVWPPLKTAFGETTDMPILQVSLPGDSSAVSAARLGKALSAIRNEGYTVIGSGQILHNLRDIFSGKPMPYAKPFLSATSAALESPDRVNDTINLTRHASFKSAHPTPEHFLPVVVAAAAAAEPTDKLEEIVMSNEGFGWASWRWSAREAQP